MKALTILTSTLGAALIGVAMGLLFAPNKGSRTRNKISRKSHEYADFVGESFDDFLNNVSDSFKTIETKTGKIAKQGKAEVKKVAADLNKKMN